MIKIRIMIIVAIIMVIGLLFFQDTLVMVFAGKGNVEMKDFEEHKEFMTSNFIDVSVEEKEGKTLLTGISSDKSTNIMVTSDGNSIEKVEAVVNGSKISEDELISVLKKNLNSVLSSVLNKKDVRNVEMYLIKEGMKQLKNDPDKIVVKNTFGNVEIFVEGDLHTGEIKLELNSK